MANRSKITSVLVLEITNPQVNDFFSKIKTIVYGQPQTHAVHITIRGPYISTIPKFKIENWNKILRGESIRIFDAGHFRNPDEEIVFFRVDAPTLRKLWWKPDFPIKKYGFRPHISIYRGNDMHFAEALRKFISNERIELSISDYQVRIYGINQPELFKWKSKGEIDFNLLNKCGKISPTFFNRLQDLVDSKRSSD